MKMVSKNSEYRRQYKKTTLVKNIPNYYEHVNYRTHRRELESAHTPISWDSEVQNTEFEDSNEDDEYIDKISLEKLKVNEDDNNQDDIVNEKHDIQKKLKDIEESDEKDEKKLLAEDRKGEKNEFEIRKDERKELVEKRKDEKLHDDVIIQIKSPEQRTLTKLAKAKLNKYASKDNQDLPEQNKPELQKEKSTDDGLLKPKKVDDKTFVCKSKPKRPDRHRPKSSSRPISAPASSMSCDDLNRPPFCAYGGGNHSNTTGQQKTYNVRASKQVDPAAVRAHYKQQEAERKRRSAERKAFLREKRKRAAQADKIARETASWQSEYCRNFPSYDSNEYERNVSSRAGKRKSHFMILW